jgi:hypothetical protein
MTQLGKKPLVQYASWMLRRFAVTGALSLALILAGSTDAHAAKLLFVSDGFTDINIPVVLRDAGHDVMTVVNDFDEALLDNPTLRGALGGYDAIYWSATAERHLSPDVFTNLTAYVRGGGRVFVTGFDSIAAPEDTLLIAFLGASGSLDAGAALGPIIPTPTSLSSGVIEIAGFTPVGHADDRDMLTGLGPDTINLAPGSLPGLPEGASWTLRTLGFGEVAYISNGLVSGDHPSWQREEEGGSGAYHAALLNFAHAGDTLTTEPGAPTFTVEGPRVIAEGRPITLTLRIDDPAGCDVGWDLDGDGEFAERLDETSFHIPAGTSDGPSTFRVAVQVSRSGLRSRLVRVVRIVNEAPRFGVNLPRLFFVGQAFAEPLPAVDPALDLDTLHFTLMRGPTGSSLDADGTLRWTPNQGHARTSPDRLFFTVQVTDDDGGSSEARWDVYVAPHRPPRAPELIFPPANQFFAEHPRLIIARGSDPEAQPITYHFEVSRNGTFLDTQLSASGALTPGAGYTSWTPSLEPEPGIWHWRAWTDDGEFESTRLSSTYSIVSPAEPETPPTQLTDGGPPTVPPLNETSGCSALRSKGLAKHAYGLIFSALAMLWWRRRRFREIG